MGQYNGYDLFEDVEDPRLRLHNRAAVGANILRSHMTGDRVSPAGVQDFLQYMEHFTAEERGPIVERLREVLRVG